MLKELVVNAAPHETRVALLENGTMGSNEGEVWATSLSTLS